MSLACEVLGWNWSSVRSIWSSYSTEGPSETVALIPHGVNDGYRGERGLPMLDHIAGLIARSALTHVPVRFSSCAETSSPEIAAMIESRIELGRQVKDADSRRDAEQQRRAAMNSLERRHEDLPAKWSGRFAAGEGAELASGNPKGSAAILGLSTVMSVEVLSVFLGVTADRARKLLDAATAKILRSLASYSDSGFSCSDPGSGASRRQAPSAFRPPFSPGESRGREACFSGAALPTRWHHLLD